MKKTLTRFFKRNPPATQAQPPADKQPETSPEGFVTPKTAKELLSVERREILIDHIWEQTSVSKESFERLYRGPIGRYAELVQELPASENHHHSYLGGMLDHGLELVLYALKLRQGYLLPIGVSPEEQAQHAGIWTAGTAYGALMHDTGKILCDIRVQTKDGEQWHPWHGPIKQPYRFQYIKGRDYKLHNAAASFLCTQILGTEVLNYLAKNQSIWSSLLYLLSGDYGRAGALAEIVSKADRASTAMNIGANPEKALQAPPESLQAHLARGLRELFTNEEYRLKINTPGAAGWLTQDGLWLVSKVVADKLRAFLLTQGVDKVPSKNSSLFDELQSHRLIEPNSEGNAIWTATVTDGNWKQQFTFLRIKPSMIWGADEYPAAFKGTVTWEGQQPDQQAQQAESVPDATHPAATHTDNLAPVEATPPTATAPAQPAQPAQPAGDDIDDVLSLFDMTDDARAPEQTAIPPKANQDQSAPTRPIETEHPPAEPVKPAKPRASTTSQARPIPAGTGANVQDKKKKPVTAPSQGITLTTENVGEQFIEWLKSAISQRDLYINDSRAPLHVVDGKAFLVTPFIFQRFTGQFPEVQALNEDPKRKDWQFVQRHFERLALHIKREDDLNIWQCTVRGPRKTGNTLNGYLMPAELLFSFQPQDNVFVAIKQD